MITKAGKIKNGYTNTLYTNKNNKPPFIIF
jgi:hypothetical protein